MNETHTARMVLRSTACPKCGARPGLPCKGERLRSGALVGVAGAVRATFTDYHAERFAAAAAKRPSVFAPFVSG